MMNTYNSEKKFSTVLSKQWTVLLARGLAAIAFAIFTWVMPGITLATLIIMLGVYFFVDGGLALWTAFSSQERYKSWWPQVIEGIVGVGIGILTFAAPGMVTKAILVIISVWAVLNGVLQIVSAIELRSEIDNEWLLILAGGSLVLFGLALIVQPGSAVLAMLGMIAMFALIYGALLVMLALKLRDNPNFPA